MFSKNEPDELRCAEYLVREALIAAKEVFAEIRAEANASRTRSGVKG
jgi:hypothetical protein